MVVCYRKEVVRHMIRVYVGEVPSGGRLYCDSGLQERRGQATH